MSVTIHVQVPKRNTLRTIDVQIDMITRPAHDVDAVDNSATL